MARLPPIAPGEHDKQTVVLFLKPSYMPPFPRVAHVIALSKHGVMNPLYSGVQIRMPSAATSWAFNVLAASGKSLSRSRLYMGRLRDAVSTDTTLHPASSSILQAAFFSLVLSPPLEDSIPGREGPMWSEPEMATMVGGFILAIMAANSSAETPDIPRVLLGAKVGCSTAGAPC